MNKYFLNNFVFNILSWIYYRLTYTFNFINNFILIVNRSQTNRSFKKKNAVKLSQDRFMACYLHLACTMDENVEIIVT